MADSPASPKRVKVEFVEISELSREDLISKLKDQEKYVKYLEDHQIQKKDDDGDPRDIDERLKQHQREAARREATLLHRLTTKEQELQDYINQLQEMKQAQTQNSSQLRSMLLDPAVNLVLQRMTKEMEDSNEKLKQTQNELSAWKFTADSKTGKSLMARCRSLLQENEDLGKMINSGRTAQLEGEIAMQKALVSEMKDSQQELDDLLGDLDEDVEGMQSMIYVLQQQLKESKEQISKLQEENERLCSSQSNCDAQKNHPEIIAVDIHNSSGEHKSDALMENSVCMEDEQPMVEAGNTPMDTDNQTGTENEELECSKHDYGIHNSLSPANVTGEELMDDSPQDVHGPNGDLAERSVSSKKALGDSIDIKSDSTDKMHNGLNNRTKTKVLESQDPLDSQEV